MEKTTKIIGHFRDIMIGNTEGDKLDLPKGVTLYLKDDNLIIEITMLPITNTKTYTGVYTITIKEP